MFTVQERITPAYAGKSSFISICVIVIEDHPRICGEKVMLCCNSEGAQGSPPHMRGKVNSGDMGLTTLRITPAYAGKSFGGSSKPPQKWDHPRICGEKQSLVSSACDVYGSPPHMRGKVPNSS